MTEDEAKAEENRNRMRALALDGQQSIREGDLAGTVECLDMIAKRSILGESSKCPRCRYRARLMRKFTLIGSEILQATSRALGDHRSSWRLRMRMRWLVLRGLWATAMLHFRMRLVLRFVPCRCPKKEDKAE